jgi:hypothetical protein
MMTRTSSTVRTRRKALLARLIAFLLILEAMFAGLYLVNQLDQLGMNGPVALALILARGLAGALQSAGGWLLATHRPQGIVLAQWGLAAGAVITILGVGFNLAPTSIYHWLRWQATAAYCLYAVAAIAFLRATNAR